MLGRYVRVRAEVANIRAFSVHADHQELLAWLRAADGHPDTTDLVHGDPTGAAALHDAIEGDLDWPAVFPTHLERVRVD